MTTVTAHRVLAQAVSPVLWDAATAMAERRAQVELNVIGCVLADPSRGISMAEEAGVVHHCFSHADLRLIYLAAKQYAPRGVDAVLQASSILLKWEGCWDDGARAYERGSKWSGASLAGLADSYPSAVDTPRQARLLVELDEAMRRADAHFDAAMRCLVTPVEAKQMNPVRHGKALVDVNRLTGVPVAALATWKKAKPTQFKKLKDVTPHQMAEWRQRARA